MDELKQHLRVAFRTLAKNPAFTAVVTLTLALGIGANAAIFTLMDQVLLRSLPVEEPERLVVLHAPGPNIGSRHSQSAALAGISYPMYADIRDKAEVFDGVVAHWPTAVHLGVKGATEQATADLVSGNFFGVLGVPAALGRVFDANDDRTRGAHPLVVLSHGFWTRRFGADPKVVGASISVNGLPMTVIGVSARGFHGIEVGHSIDVFVPLAMQETVEPNWGGEVLSKRRTAWLTPMARLKDGVGLEQAKAGVNVLYRQILRQELEEITTRSERFRKEFPEKTLQLLPGARGTSELRGQSQTTLLVLMGMVGLVLLIACANVANLLLARASARQREVAMRLALGASRGRMVRQFLVESLALSVIGGLLGLVVSSWTANLLLSAEPGGDAIRVFSADPDWRVAGFALLLSLATGIAFGLVPALQSTRPDVFPTLKTESGSVVSGSRSVRFRQGLVVAQVALSLLLLVGAGLFTRSLMNLRSLDPGFKADHVLAFSINPSLNGYDDAREERPLQAAPGRDLGRARGGGGLPGRARPDGRQRLLQHRAGRGLRVEGRREHEPQLQRVGARLLPHPGHDPPPRARFQRCGRRGGAEGGRGQRGLREVLLRGRGSRGPALLPGSPQGRGVHHRGSGAGRQGFAAQGGAPPHGVPPLRAGNGRGHDDLLRAHGPRARRPRQPSTRDRGGGWTRTCPSPT